MPVMRALRRGGSASGTAVVDGYGQPPDETPPEGRSRRRYDPAWDEWKRPRRWPGVLLSCVIILGFLSVVIWHYRPHTTKVKHHSIGQGILSEGSFVPTITGAGSTVRTFHGTTSKAGLNYTTNGGLLILHAACLCTYNFVVTIADSSGNVTALPVNATGHFNGTYNITSPAGRYAITVVGSGPWSVMVMQPSAAVPVIVTPTPKPFGYFSTGESVIGPFPSSDKYLQFKFLSLTNGTVFVHVLNLAGARVGDPPFLGKGFYEKSATLLGLPNPYYLEIDASGFWKLYVNHIAPN